MEGDTITRQNQEIKTKAKIIDFKTTRVQLGESTVMQVKHQMVNTSFTMQKKVPVTSNSELVPLEQLHLIIRTLLTKSTPNVPLAGSTISLGKNCSGSRNIIYCKWVLNPISKSPISEENTKLEKNVKRTIFIIGTERYENVPEVSYPKSSTHKKEISEQPKKKDGGSRPVINLENINKLNP